MKKAAIHQPYNKFKGFALENGLTYADIGQTLGITSSTVSMKVNGYSDFYVSELKLLKQKYNMTEEIFL